MSFDLSLPFFFPEVKSLPVVLKLRSPLEQTQGIVTEGIVTLSCDSVPGVDMASRKGGSEKSRDAASGDKVLDCLGREAERGAAGPTQCC